jgi:radical SAM protein with 4Fe4S-binding SPASM domain
LPLEGFKNLYECYIDCIENLGLDYVPTFDYRYNVVNENNVYEYIDTLKEQLLKIAKYCLINKKESPKTDLLMLNEHRMCSAGCYYFAINSNMEISRCHDTAYYRQKVHTIGTIYDNDINKKINDMFEYHSIFTSIVNEECKKCDVTLCKKCCAGNYQTSKKTDYLDRYYDKNNDNLCKLYKAVSKISKAYNILRLENKK